MGTFVSSWPLGIALGLIAFGPLGIAYGWTAVMHVSTACLVLGFAVVALAYRDPPGMPPPGPAKLRLDLNRREWTLVCIAGAIWALFNVAYIVLVSFGPELFTQRGFSLTEASFLMSLVGWTLIPAIPLASFVAERSGRPRLVLLIAFIVLALALALLPFVDGVAFLATFAIIVLCNGVPPGLVMALPAQSLRAETRAGGMGVYYTWYYAAMALLPGGAGLARDLAASAAAPILFAATMMALCGVAVILFTSAQGKPKP
jgi:predicted MFS family arabinose efflux permease